MFIHSHNGGLIIRSIIKLPLWECTNKWEFINVLVDCYQKMPISESLHIVTWQKFVKFVKWQKLFVDGSNVVIPFKIRIMHRTATHIFAPRPLIFKLQQEVWKFYNVCVSWSSRKTDLEKKLLNFKNWVCMYIYISKFWIYMSLFLKGYF